MDGWIILDKPVGYNSRKAGAILSRMYNAKTFGHIGTLDPMASGLILIGLGQATKMIPFMQEQEKNSPNGNIKEYLFSVKFGIMTDTLDITGADIAQSDIIPIKDNVLNALQKLSGDIMQVPPNYSAVHIGGQRAHKLARSGQDFELPPRPVKIYALELIGSDENLWTFRVVCSPGTYVRSLARDIADLCGTLGVASMIRRTKTNGFDIQSSVKLDFLEDLVNNSGALDKYLKQMDFGLGDIPVLDLVNKDADLYRKGGFIGVNGFDSNALVRVYNESVFVGIGQIDNGLLKPKRTIN